MAGDDKKYIPKAPSKEKSSPQDKTPAEAPPKAEAKPDVVEAKPDVAAPSNYSRGEGQKPVSQAYKDNWNAIYAKKKKR